MSLQIVPFPGGSRPPSDTWFLGPTHRGSTGNETWSHRYRRSARWSLEKTSTFIYSMSITVKKSMDEGFTYSNLATVSRSRRHWWFPTSCFGITNHSKAASLWFVRQDRATINSGSPPSCGAPFWQWPVASPSEMGWLASKVSRYLSILWHTVSAQLMLVTNKHTDIHRNHATSVATGRIQH